MPTQPNEEVEDQRVELMKEQARKRQRKQSERTTVHGMQQRASSLVALRLHWRLQMQ